MSLQLILGGSGSGKSHILYNTVIEEAMRNERANYLVIVPEQYTMETQKRLIQMHPNHGIMNIDILSFQRLAFRVFSETGYEASEILDDTGKNLIIRKVMESNKKNLKMFHNHVNKTGFVSEMKSIISELLQYTVTPELLGEMSDQTDNFILSSKMKDVCLTYSAFREYINEKYITSEEVLDVLCRYIEQSDMIKNSTIAIDGFTGFTPIQYKLLGLVLGLAKKVMITVTIDCREKIHVHQGMQNLFHLSRETISKLIDLADRQRITIEESVKLNDTCSYRLKDASALSFLERNLFRFQNKRYHYATNQLSIYEALQPKEEISYIAGEIMNLTSEHGYRFRDIAVITGDMQTYGSLAASIFSQNGIAAFIDNKRSIMGNPLVEFLRSALESVDKNYSYESMFRFLKTGFTDISRKEIDELENYCLAMGIRGFKKWNEKWVRNYRNTRGEKADLEYINDIREKVIAPFWKFENKIKDESADIRCYVKALYELMVDTDIERKLNTYTQEFEQSKDQSKSGEFSQLYKKVMDLFDKIVNLLGEEKVGIREFSKILDAGFEDIKIGLIPPSADCVLVGDIERTRIGTIKVLFFAGVNDGIIPKKADSSGIFSELDRQTLEQMNMKLTPSAREKAFIQKFYLYMNLTKPSERLYLSYSKNDVNGKSLKASYLLHTIKKMFPLILINNEESQKDAFSYLSIPKSELKWNIHNILQVLDEASASAIYSEEIQGSVTRIENFGSCAFAHFLNYGLGLVEREKYEIAVRDIGTILHAVLERISVSLKERNLDFSILDEDSRKKLVSENVIEVTSDYGNTIMQDNKRNEYLVKSLTDLTDRTVWALGRQLAQGEFVPDLFEIPFELEAQEIYPGMRMRLNGKIDRIDIYEDEQHVYVKVIDYKSGNSDFELLKTYYGLKLQLIAYMKAAMQVESKRHPGKKVIPAGVFYYHMDNPIVESEGETESETQEKILEQLCTKGVVNKDKAIVQKLDKNLAVGKSKVIPVKYNKDGELADTKNSITSEQFLKLDEFVFEKMKQMSSQIAKGDIELNPYQDKKSNSCTYCPYHAVCGFYETFPSMKYRKLKNFSDEEIWKKIYQSENKNKE